MCFIKYTDEGQFLRFYKSFIPYVNLKYKKDILELEMEQKQIYP